MARLLKLTTPYKWLIAFSVLLGFATLGSSVGLMATAGYLISASSLEAATLGTVWFAIIGVRFFGITRPAWRYAWQYISHSVTFRVLAHLRTWVYGSIEPLAPARLQQYRSGDLLQRLVADVETLENFYQRVIAPPLIALLVAVASFGVLAYFGSWQIGLVMLVGMGMIGIGVPLLVQRLSVVSSARLVAQKGRMSGQLVEMVQGVGDLLLLDGGECVRNRLCRMEEEIGRNESQLATIRGIGSGLTDLITYATILGVLFLAIPAVQNGTIDGVLLALLVLATLATFEAAQPLPLAWQHLEKSMVSAERLFSLTDQSPVITEPITPAPAPNRYDVLFKDVSFHYEIDNPVLEKVNISIPEGTCVIISGESGAGKTTLLNLLLRFWEYDGSLKIGRRELRELPSEMVRSLFSVVGQETTLFNTTIRANLQLAGNGEIEQAAKVAQIHDFIVALPAGYETVTGEDGVQLSGGQRQRLGIARAILHNAPILLLDEPLVNLDWETAQRVSADLAPFIQTRTTLIVTHQPMVWQTILPTATHIAL